VPIIVVGPLADLFGPEVVIVGSGILVGGVGIRSVIRPAAAGGARADDAHMVDAVDPVAVATVPLALREHPGGAEEARRDAPTRDAPAGEDRGPR
jgi:hypothetical protein